MIRIGAALLAAAVSYVLFSRPALVENAESASMQLDLVGKNDQASTSASLDTELRRAYPISETLLDLRLQTLDWAEVQANLKAIGSDFWENNSNAEIVLQRAYSKLAKEQGSLFAMLDAIAFVNESKIIGGAKRRCFRAALLGSFRYEVPPSNPFGNAISKLSNVDALSCLEAYLLMTKIKGGAEIWKKVEETWKTSGRKIEDETYPDLVRVVVRVLARKGETLEAVTILSTMKESKERFEILSEVGMLLQGSGLNGFGSFIASVTAVDVKEAAKLCSGLAIDIKSMPTLIAMIPDSKREAFLREYCVGLRSKNPTDIAELARAIPAQTLPRSIASIFCANLAAAGGGALNEWLSVLPETDRAAFLDQTFNEHIFDSSLETDPNAKRAWLEARSALPKVDNGIAILLSGMTREQKQSMLPYVERLQPPLKDQLITDIYRFDGNGIEQMALDPAGTMAKIGTLPSKAQKEVRDNAVLGLVSLEPIKGMALVESLGQPELLVSALRLAVGQRNIPLQTQAELLLKYLPSNAKDAANCVGVLMERYGEIEPSTGVALLKQFGSPATQDAAVTSLARSWSASDPIAASDWIAQMPAGHLRDLAVRELVPSSADDPEMALINAKAISDPNLRLQAATYIFNAWESLNPEVSLEYARTAGFLDDEIVKIRQALTAKQDVP